MSNITIIYTTLPNKVEAERVGEDLVTRGYAACVNVSSPMTSFYAWKGDVQRDEEVALMIKTSRNRVDEVMLEVHRLHPYETPAIAIWEATAHPEFAKFVDEHTKEF